jgi:hypothetical protein
MRRMKSVAQNRFLLSIEECRRRQEPIDYATASVEQSRFKIIESIQERSRVDVEGQLSWDEFCNPQR